MKLEWKTCFKVGLSVFLLYLCITYWKTVSAFAGLLLGAASPLLVGCVIAYLVNILMSWYEKYYFPKAKNKLLVKSRRPVCMIAAFVTLVAVVVLVILLVVPELVACVQLLLVELAELLTKAVEYADKQGWLPDDIVASLSKIDWKSRLSQIIQVVTAGLGSVLEVLITTVSSVFSWVVSALLALIFAIYLLSGKEKLAGQFHRVSRRYLKPAWCDKLDYVLRTVHDCFRRYIVGQCLEAVILGVLCALGMLLLGLPYATMIGALVAFTALIPVAGAYIGAGVGAVMILTVSPVKAIVFLIFIVVLQQLEGNIIYPRVVGSSMGLPGIWVLAAVTVGGGVMGIPGMIIGVPLAAAAYRMLRDNVNRVPIAAQPAETGESPEEVPAEEKSC